MKTYNQQTIELVNKGFSTDEKVVFVDGVPTHTFTKQNKTILLIHLGLGKGYGAIEVAG